MKRETVAIHEGYTKDSQKTMAVPIYQTTAYDFGNADFAADSFNLKQGSDNIYTRIGNPTTSVLEKRFAKLEKGSASLAVSSGMSAIFYSVLNIAESGDNIIASSQLYGGTTTLFTHTLKRLGIEARFFNIDNPEEIEKLVDSRTKGIFFESLSNPTITIADIEKIAEIGNRHGLITIIDNTVATPILCNPIDFGIDIVVHSASKWTTGQGLAIGGIVVEREGLWKKIDSNPRYSQFYTPDESYHGLKFTDEVARDALFTFRMRLILLRDTGAVLSPFNSWLFIQGLETLPLRVQRHSENGLAIAKFLESHPKVVAVNYPKLESSKYYELAKKYFPNGANGLLSFEVGDYEKAKKIVDSVEIFTLVANIGDSKSIITHPASTTHQQLSESELQQAGISAGLIRLSVGLENVDDLIQDLENSLNRI